MLNKIILILLLFFNAPYHSYGQEENESYSQLWADFILHKTFKNSVRYFGTMGPRFLLKEESSWNQFELTQSAHYKVFWNIDGIAGLLLNYTQQTDTTNAYNSYEVQFNRFVLSYVQAVRKIRAGSAHDTGNDIEHNMEFRLSSFFRCSSGGL